MDLDRGIKKQVVLTSDNVRMNEEELHRRLKELADYKLAPAGDIRVKYVLARGERIFAQSMGERRQAVANVMGKLHEAISTQNDQKIANCVRETEAVLDFVEGKN